MPFRFEEKGETCSSRWVLNGPKTFGGGGGVIGAAVDRKRKEGFFEAREKGNNSEVGLLAQRTQMGRGRQHQVKSRLFPTY